MAFAEVAFPQPPHYGQSFSYIVPSSIALEPGDAVLAPFGARTLAGVVVALGATPAFDGELRALEQRLGDQALLLPHQIAFARWLADRYYTPLGQALALLLPPGSREPADFLSPAPVEAPNALRLVVTADEALRRLARLKPAAAGRAMKVVVALLEAGGTLPLTTLSRTFGMSRATRAVVEGGGLASTVGLRQSAPTERDLLGVARAAGVAFTPDQQQAIAQLDEAMQRRFAGDPAPGVFLLHGVTGSGKTEVYIAALRLARARGRGGLVLVPEISLTPQTAARFEPHFPGAIAVLHGRISPARRRVLWHQLRSGQLGVAIGARSALFAPVPRLGLIVLDEEHDPSFKQSDPAPRYQTRSAALELARLTGAVVVLGSATPDLESSRRAADGAYRLLSLPSRVGSGGSDGNAELALPEVTVIDMAEELRAGNGHAFSRSLDAALKETLAAGEQSLLFLNRRGTASLILCRDCGYAPRCPRCSVAYALHRDVGRLMCHQCYHSRRVPAACPKCRSTRFRPVGIGTHRLEELVRERYPEARILRWDGDTAGTQAQHEAIARTIARHEVDIVVGTQVVAKGHDFGALTLVGVVSADLSLNVPDFRAAERTFQLLVQVGGRAGRRTRRGKVIIQTYAPGNYAVRAAAAGDYDAFYAQELAFRRELAYPPCAPMTRLLLQDRRAAWAEREATRYAELLETERRRLGLGGPQVVGPAPCYFSRVASRWRWQILLRGGSGRELLAAAPPPRGWIIDVEPVDLL